MSCMDPQKTKYSTLDDSVDYQKAAVLNPGGHTENKNTVFLLVPLCIKFFVVFFSFSLVHMS